MLTYGKAKVPHFVFPPAGIIRTPNYLSVKHLKWRKKEEEQISIRWHSRVWLINSQQAKMCHWHAALRAHSMCERGCVCTWMGATLNNGLTWDELGASCSAGTVSLIVSQLSATLLQWLGKESLFRWQNQLYSAHLEGRGRERGDERSENWKIWLSNLGQGSDLALILYWLSVSSSHYVPLNCLCLISSASSATALTLSAHHLFSPALPLRHSDIPHTKA